MGLDDFAPASKAAVNLDEDLFDFPPLEIPEPPKAEEPASAEAAPAAEASAESAPASAQAAQQPGACTGLDPELDEDIFEFPPLDLSSLGLAADGSPSTEVEQSIDAAAQVVSDLLEDDLSDIMRDAHVEQKKSEAANRQATAVEPEQVAAATAQAPAAAAPQVAAPAPLQQVAPQMMAAPVGLHTVAVAAPPSKAMMVLTGATIFFMVGLLGIAWRATTSFQQQIRSVSQSVEAGTAQLQNATTSSLDELARIERELLLNQMQAAQVNHLPGTPQAIPPMAAPYETILEVARQAIASARFEDARRMLFTLLAEADRFPADARESLERDASFLIAASHKAEAQLHRGGQE